MNRREKQQLLWLSAVGRVFDIFTDDDFTTLATPPGPSMVGVGEMDTLALAMQAVGGLTAAIAPPVVDLPGATPETESAMVSSYITNALGLPFKKNNTYAYPVKISEGVYGAAVTKEYLVAMTEAKKLFNPSAICDICKKQHHALRHVAIGLTVSTTGLRDPVLSNHFRMKPTVWEVDGVLMTNPIWTALTLEDMFIHKGGDKFGCSRCPLTDDQTAKKLTYTMALELLTKVDFKGPADELAMTRAQLFSHLYTVHAGDVLFYLMNSILPIPLRAPCLVKFSEYVGNFQHVNRLRTMEFVTFARHSTVLNYQPGDHDEDVIDNFFQRWGDTMKTLDQAWRKHIGLTTEDYSSSMPKLLTVKTRKNWESVTVPDHVVYQVKKRMRGEAAGGEPPKRRITDPSAQHRHHIFHAGAGALINIERMIAIDVVDETLVYGEVVHSDDAVEIIFGGKEFPTTPVEANSVYRNLTDKYFLMSGGTIFGKCKQIDIFKSTNGTLFVYFTMEKSPNKGAVVPVIEMGGGSQHFQQMLPLMPSLLAVLERTVLIIKDLGKAPVWGPGDIKFIEGSNDFKIVLPQKLEFARLDLTNYIAIANIVLTASADRAQYTEEERGILAQQAAVLSGLQSLRNAIDHGYLQTTTQRGIQSGILVQGTMGEQTIFSIFAKDSLKQITHDEIIQKMIVTETALLFGQLEDMF